jgi:hypothetical protein
MSDQKQEAAPAAQAKPNPFLPMALLISALMFVFLGLMMPDLTGMTGPEATWLSIAFYVAAAGDVAIALYLRGKSKKGRQSATSGGTIQRQ